MAQQAAMPGHTLCREQRVSVQSPVRKTVYDDPCSTNHRYPERVCVASFRMNSGNGQQMKKRDTLQKQWRLIGSLNM